jgi:hypothetical protein
MSLLRSIENGVTVSTEIELAETREPQYMSENHWRALYQAAVFEVDPEKVGARATAAEIAINTHVFEDYQHLSRDERADMQRALSALDVLKLESDKSTGGELKRGEKI